MKIVTTNVPKDLQRITPIAVNFFQEHYFAPIAKTRIEEVAIRFLSTTYEQSPDTLAYCDHDEETRIPTSFELVFNDNKYRDIRYRHYIMTIFHELTHANQYLTGRMRTVQAKGKRPSYTIWEGTKYPDDTLYWKQPWEIEAYGTETCAYSHFAILYKELQLKRYKSRYNGRSSSDPIDERIDNVMKKGVAR